jgi:hypothetical protein
MEENQMIKPPLSPFVEAMEEYGNACIALEQSRCLDNNRDDVSWNRLRDRMSNARHRMMKFDVECADKTAWR